MQHATRRAFQGERACRAGTGPDLWQDIVEHATSSEHANTTPTPTAVHSKATYWEWPTLGQLGLQEYTGDFRSPLLIPPPPAVTSVLGKPFPKDHQNVPGLAVTTFLSPPQKTQGPHPALPTEVPLP